MSHLDSRHSSRASAQTQIAPLLRDRVACTRGELDHLPPAGESKTGLRARSGRTPGRSSDSHADLRYRNDAPAARGDAMRRVVLAGIVLTAACGPKRPPPSFAPDPGLVEQIRGLRMSTSTRACPGESFAAGYTAVLKDGSLIPFETRYDEDHPPRLHVVFLQLSSNEATPLEGGGWSAARDPLATAITGFRLTALLKAKPSITTSTVLAPDYSCLQHTFGFRGVGAGASGPQVTVRLGILRSPFYDRLLVAGIEVEDAPPYYLLADARAVPPSDWLIIEARGSRGSRGAEGTAGVAGTNGRPGCPSGAGGPGGAGGNGSGAGPGGPGGGDTDSLPGGGAVPRGT